MTLFQDLYWPRASSLLQRGGCGEADVALAGVPWFMASLSPGRCDLGPSALRAALSRFSCFDVEYGIDLQRLCVYDWGDLDVSAQTPECGFAQVVKHLMRVRESAPLMLTLGGDNSITRPFVHAQGESLAALGLITLDAHFDLRSTAQGLSNGNPISALLGDGMPGHNIVQIGVQSFSNSAHYAQVAKTAGMRCITIEQVNRKGMAAAIHQALAWLECVEKIVIDIDLDVLDRVWMPAAPGSRPGGLTPFQLGEAAYLLGCEPRVVAADLVELDPVQDIGDVSVMNAAKCLLAFLSGYCSR